ncbi:hypothetical protein D2V17_05345 [Aurantiacibacter xanthus]|uniref:Uncharacterized protein n=1 Tax=Aurantiacibacter xanthus TaxID=1784712 RepID=A0A3A1PAP6_9SPHN|nr:hypothetical protein [Aurantiacibacter xanthus]RIV89831.1 hypothetical protein D2V17_05345 [Aurantiacibacter xanthus]
MARSIGLALVSGVTAMVLSACSSEADSPVATASEAPSPATATPDEEAPDNGRVPLTAGTTAAQATTLCAADEAQMFSCTLRGGRIASVCLAQGAQGEFAQYRFGRPGAAPELVWPTKPGEQIEWASAPYSGGGEAQMSFAVGDVRYVVYSKVVRTNFTPGETNDPAITDGVVVLRSGKVAARFSCDGTELKPVDVNAARAHLPEAGDLFTYDTE